MSEKESVYQLSQSLVDLGHSLVKQYLFQSFFQISSSFLWISSIYLYLWIIFKDIKTKFFIQVEEPMFLKLIHFELFNQSKL